MIELSTLNRKASPVQCYGVKAKRYSNTTLLYVTLAVWVNLYASV